MSACTTRWLTSRISSSTRSSLRPSCQRLRTSFFQSHRFGTSSSSMSPTPVPDWASVQARTAAEGLLRRWYAYDNTDAQSSSPRPATEYTQTLDANQLGLLRVLVDSMVPLTTTRFEAEATRKSASDTTASAEEVLRGQMAALPRAGDILLPAEHLVYFTPRVPISILAPDGSDPTFNPPGGIFTRCMWAGGEMTFLHPERLCVGAEVRERTFVEDALVKRLQGGKGDEMIVVWLRKEYEVAGEVVARDRRSWIFRKALEPASASEVGANAKATSIAPATATLDEQQDQRPDPETIELQLSPAALFRFSALTYNAHQIHLDSHWARTVEGHADVVVHGPLNVLLLCRYWLMLEQRKVPSVGRRRRLARVVYRAKSPVYAHEKYQLRRVSTTTDGADVVCAVRSDNGRVIMEATVYTS
ncbi:hypothetical protein V8E36_006894 [Tilletia maclaganii]